MFDDFDPSINPDGSRNIFLSRGYVAVVDEADYAELSQYRWFAKFGGYRGPGAKPYAARSVRVGNKIRCVRMHRAIMNAPDDMDVDHGDGDTLNNRRSNLEIVTKPENSRRRHERQEAAKV
jgi:hypothetical protein